jgi:hypothetical protein
MISQLQFIVYLLLMEVNFPGNMHYLLSNLMGLADLKIVPTEWLEKLFQ